MKSRHQSQKSGLDCMKRIAGAFSRPVMEARVSGRISVAVIFLLAFILFLIVSIRAQARVENTLSRRIDALISGTGNIYDEGPRLQLTAQTDYLGLGGSARAREIANERFYPSSNMGDLDLNDNMGLTSMVMYEIGTDFRIGDRNHVEIKYLWSRSEGEGYTGYPTGFNDHDYYTPGETESRMNLDSMQVEWYYRTIDVLGNNGRYTLDLGAGAMNLRSEISYTGGFNEDFETEVIFAPFMPYLTGRAEWRPGTRISLGTDVQVSLYSVQSKELTELPADGRYVRAEVYGRYPLNDYLSLTAGVNYWNVMVAFDGIETNDHTGYDHQADNKLDMWMAGAYVGVTMEDPQVPVISALRSLFR